MIRFIRHHVLHVKHHKSALKAPPPPKRSEFITPPPSPTRQTAPVARPTPEVRAFQASAPAPLASTPAPLPSAPAAPSPARAAVKLPTTRMERVRHEHKQFFREKVKVTGYSDFNLVGDDLTTWSVRLDLDEGSLARDLANARRMGQAGFITLRIDFPKNYPAQPPRLWIQTPRLQQRTGFVSGGAICMPMLMTTGGRDGWQSNYTLEGVFHTLRANLQAPEAGGRVADWGRYTRRDSDAGMQRARSQHARGAWVEG